MCHFPRAWLGRQNSAQQLESLCIRTRTHVGILIWRRQGTIYSYYFHLKGYFKASNLALLMLTNDVTTTPQFLAAEHHHNHSTASGHLHAHNPGVISK